MFMTIYNYVNGECFTLKILCPEISELFLSEQNKIEKYLIKKMPVEKIHIGLKYMAYENDYSDKHMMDLIPEIKKIAEKYLPMQMEIDELGGFWNKPEWPSKPIIFLKVKLTKELKNFHNELRDCLKDKSDTFFFAEGKNYTPHITLGVGNEKYTKELIEIVKSPRVSTIFSAKKLAMRLKGGKTHTII